MRCLHVAALPFPSPQGTQALLHAMLSALAHAGHETHLLCYGYGSRCELDARYALHRLPLTLGLRSLRSGPSVRKLFVDLALAHEVRRLSRALRPDVLVAHHFEAAGACALAAVAPFAYVAHTSLGEELPSYFPPAFAPAVTRAGALLDHYACTRASQVLAVSPLLVNLLHASAGVRGRALDLPWTVAAASTAEERRTARARLGFAPDDRVVLYAGNLDGYQGLPVLAEAVARLRARDPRWRWLVASESPRAARARLLRTTTCRFAGLADEAERRLVHAAADVVAVPRASPGGVPIKLLDALARGAFVVASRRACAGLDLAHVCSVVDDDAPEAFAAALEACVARERPISNELARDYVRRAHSDAAFLASFLCSVRPA